MDPNMHPKGVPQQAQESIDADCGACEAPADEPDTPLGKRAILQEYHCF
jgi:hypothetical protein